MHKTTINGNWCLVKIAKDCEVLYVDKVFHLDGSEWSELENEMTEEEAEEIVNEYFDNIEACLKD